MNDQNYAAKVNAAFIELKRRLHPAAIAETETNAIYIRNYLKKHSLDLTNADHLQQTVTALDDKELIEWDTPPAPAAPPVVKTAEQTAAEFQAKEQARILREQIENSKPFEHSQKLAEQQAKDTEAKLQEKAKNEIGRLIVEFSVNGLPGRIDYAKTEACQAALRGIRINRRGKVDWVLTLKVVQAAYNNESPASIIQAAEKAIENFNDHNENKKQRTRVEEQQRWYQRPR